MNHQTFALTQSTTQLMLSNLNSREQEILQLISHGYSTKDICAKLYLAKGTVETYRGQLLSKLDCNNMAHLVRKGFEMGLLIAHQSRT